MRSQIAKKEQEVGINCLHLLISWNESVTSTYKSYALQELKCVNINSVPKYNQSSSDCLRVQLLMLTLQSSIF